MLEFCFVFFSQLNLTQLRFHEITEKLKLNRIEFIIIFKKKKKKE